MSSSLYGAGLYGAGYYGVGSPFPEGVTVPSVTVQAAFGSYPRDATYTWTTIHDTDNPHDDTGYVRQFQWQRGLDDLIGRTQTGTGSLLILNVDRAWDPQNADSDFYPNVRPDLPIRAYATLGGVTYDLFQHYMSGFPRKRVGPNYSELTVPTVDGFAGLALALPQPDYASLTFEPTGANNTIVFTAVNPGIAEEDITVKVWRGSKAAMRISVNGKAIDVRYHFAGLGGDPPHTAQDIIDAINADPSASQLVVASNGTGSDGTGVIDTDLEETHLAGADAASFPEESTGERIVRVLEQAGVPSSRYDIDDGTVDVIAAPFSSNDQGRLLAHLLDVAGEPGEFTLAYINGSGVCRFIDRNGLYTNGQQGEVAATFSDERDDGYPIYVDSTPNYDREHVINQWVGTRDGGVTQIVQDQDSIDKSSGISSHSVQSLLTSDVKVQTAMMFGRDEYGQPVQRLQSITVMPGADAEAWAACLSLELGDRVRVLEHPPGGGDPIDENYVVISLAGQMGPDSIVASQFTFGLWPIRIDNFFVWDDATYGDPDTNVLAYN